MEIKALFTDVGGVLLTNGWESEYRKRAAQQFHFDADEMEHRHRLAFDTFEIGKLTFDDTSSYIIAPGSGGTLTINNGGLAPGEIKVPRGTIRFKVLEIAFAE